MGTYWRVSKETFNELDRDNRIWWGKDGANMPRQKRFLNEVKQGIVPQTLWGHDEVGHTQDAKRELLSIVDFKSAEDVLNTVKPVSLIRRVLQISEREI
jgi:adenine-specific DNA-methyltransferase